MPTFELITETRIEGVRKLQEAFKKKKELEKTICTMIREFEDQTGLAIDMIKYQRDITLPIVGPKYTDLTIVMTSEDNL
jgi:hypothetical protein